MFFEFNKPTGRFPSVFRVSEPNQRPGSVPKHEDELVEVVQVLRR